VKKIFTIGTVIEIEPLWLRWGLYSWEMQVTVHGYSLRIPFLNMFPNATSVEAPQHCMEAPSSSIATTYFL
jgi:hypothetical protein